MTSSSIRTATRTHSFTESVIREMTRVAREHDSINLAQGFPDFPAPELLKEAACAAIRADVNQYAITWGTPNLRHALAEKYGALYGMDVDTEREITVTCGATEAMAAVMLATVNPGDEVIVLEPFYENYGPDAVLSQAKPVFLPLEAPEYRLDRAHLESVVTEKTRAIVLNTPNNPTGRVFDREELQAVADVCREHDILAITDEIYEHILYEGEHHVLATFEGMRERTIVISGLSKTFSVTGCCKKPVPSASESWDPNTTKAWSKDTEPVEVSWLTHYVRPASSVPPHKGPTMCSRTSVISPMKTMSSSRNVWPAREV